MEEVMKIIRKAAALGIAATMAVTALAGCGTSSSSSSSASGGGSSVAAEDLKSDGKVLNIYCWNTEFQVRLESFYPDYEIVDKTTGKIGDVTVKFHITANENNAYQDNLDSTLLNDASANADDKIDIFLVEADYALKYVDTDYTLDVKKLGITDADLSDQYQYTKDVTTDANGVLKGVSWQACPGVLIYNKAIAKDVLGSDNPDEVQKAVSDWDTFDKTAATMKSSGYYMLAGYDDAYRVYSNNVSSKWVVDGKINIDDRLLEWVEQTKEYTDKGYNKKTVLWDPDWSANFATGQDVFSYFGPAWFVDYTLAQKDENDNYTNADTWAVCSGPEGYFWGGTWICASAGTDNADLVKDIILEMTCNADNMKGIVTKYNDFVNNEPAMDEMAEDTSYKSDFLGINPIPIFKGLVDKIELKYLTTYDQGCNEEFQEAMRDYFNGNSTYDEALAKFKEDILVKYPNLEMD